MRSPAYRVRVAVGALAWAALLLLARSRLFGPEAGESRRAMEGVASYLLQRGVPVVFRFNEDVEIAVGDLIYHHGSEGSLVLAGEVRALRAGGAVLPFPRAHRGRGVREVECFLSGGSPRNPSLDVRARLISVPESASWVLRTLLPPEKLTRIAYEWNRVLLLHREEIFAVLSPVFREVLRDAGEVLAQDLPGILDARREKLGEIGERLQEEIIEGEFAPLLTTELWPIIERRARPTLDAIGREVWERLPLWSFTWRFLYQNLPLTSDAALRKAMDEFWQRETVPILKAHADDFLGILKDIAGEASRNPKVGAAFRRSFERLLRDEELHHELRLVFQEVVLDNPNFHEKMLARWGTPEVARAVEVLTDRLEPLARRIGDIVLGTREAGITPEFARVLRTQILEKDRRFLILERADAPRSKAPLALPRLEPGAVITAVVERG